MAYETYKVQAGETLTEIAHRYGTTPQALVRLNGIAGPKMVHEGMELVVPVDEAHDEAVKTAKEAQARSVAAAQEQAIAQAKAVAAAAEAAKKSAPAFKTIKYTVKAGETLTEVAGRYGTTPQALVRLNGIAGPKMVHEGMEIFIPDGSLGEAIEDAGDAQARSIAAAQAEAIAQAQAMAAAAEKGAAPVFKTIKYTVQPGETLTEIAHRYGTTPQALVRLNGIPGPKMVEPGMEIYIPDNSEHEAAVKAAEEAQAKAIEAAKEKADAQEKMIAAVKAAAQERGQKA